MPPVTKGRVSLPDRYRVVRHIANGGMASVWAAEDELLGRLVAVKVLSAGFAGDASAASRFQREARSAARVSDHPHVVTIFDVGEHDGQAFIVMEYCPGGTVADRLRRPEPLPHPAAIEWLDGTAGALDHAHSRDIVHRDVKPANLLLDGAGRVAVADFGIARLATDSALTQTGQVLGTAAYLSPEQALGKPATAASDRYALAVVAYELLTGRKPFEGEHAAAHARQHIESPPPAASDVADLPAAVDAVLARGLAKEPSQRPATASDFVEDLRGALGGRSEPVTAPTAVAPARFRREPTPPPRTPPRGIAAAGQPRSRRPFLIALAALVFVLAAVIAAIAGGGGGGGGGGAGNHSGTTTAAKTPAKTTKARPKKKKVAPAPAAAQTQPPTQTQPPATDKRALALQGHSLIAQGNPAAAIDPLSRAVKDCPVSTTDPCAYALFDLGHALRLAGRPAEAIPVLQQRLQNPNQRGTVQQELELAQAAVNGGATAPGNGNGKGNGGGQGKGHKKD
jgi:eukaryotic-like serine/threonine-protein kinase